MRWKRGRRGWALAVPAFVVLAALQAPGAASAHPRSAPAVNHPHLDCAGPQAYLCPDVYDSEAVFGEGVYVGHDEPSNLFYDSRKGAGNNNRYVLRIPREAPRLPTQDAKGGTWNFQIHPAFWFGMALCDNESAPEFTHAPCQAGSDANIFDDANPISPRYIGKHPGTAFLEVQFYPPGWAPLGLGTSCDARKWCAAMAIFSLSLDQNNNVANNADCLNRAGLEPADYAFITLNGKPHAPPDPLAATAATFAPDRGTDLFMNAGDVISLRIADSAAGLRVDLADLSAHTRGSMTASASNGFGQVVFDPAASTCSTRPYTFRPMYATSSEHTRVPWAAHSYNVAFSDEIGHFEYCDQVNPDRTCAANSEPGGPDADDVGCFGPEASLLVRIGGCLGLDGDFDGVTYQKVWPGSGRPSHDARFTPEPILFTSPVFNGGRRYQRSAFEADLPRIEAADIIQGHPACDRTTGANCVNPPPGANFYPLFTTRVSRGVCLWQFGGAGIPGTQRTFGGTSASEFGPLLTSVYPGAGGQPRMVINNFRRVLSHNPC